MRPDIFLLCSQLQVSVGTEMASRQVRLDFDVQIGIQFFI
jgi:hypothetical protein